MAFDYVIQNGIVTENEYQYAGKENGQGSCSKFQSGQKISSYRQFQHQNEADLKDAVCRFGPVAVSMDAKAHDFRYYKKGVYNSTDCSSTITNHAVVAVGYGVDEATKEPYWLIKNSWGTEWGEKGYGRLRRDFNNLCGIASFTYVPVS